jgi:hypothetical protein
LQKTLHQQGIPLLALPNAPDFSNETKKSEWIQQIADLLPISSIVLLSTESAPAFFDHIDDLRLYNISLPPYLVLV